MGITFLGSDDVVWFKTNRWWAEGGLIHFEDDGAILSKDRRGSMTVRTCLERLKGLNDMIGNSRTGKGPHRPDEMTAYREFIDGIITLCQKAKLQGCPDDPRNEKQLREQSRSRTLVVPNALTSL